MTLLTATQKPCQPNLYCTHEYGGDDTKGHPESLQPKIEQAIKENMQDRLAIVTALGGEHIVQGIPMVGYPEEKTLMSNFVPDQPISAQMGALRKLEIFPEGHNMVQGEDPVGRKFVALKLHDKQENKDFAMVVFQRYRETTACFYSSRDPNPAARAWWSSNPHTNEAEKNAAKFVKEIVAGTHQRYVLIKA